jgi:hypothetical protein
MGVGLVQSGDSIRQQFLRSFAKVRAAEEKVGFIDKALVSGNEEQDTGVCR